MNNEVLTENEAGEIANYCKRGGFQYYKFVFTDNTQKVFFMLKDNRDELINKLISSEYDFVGIGQNTLFNKASIKSFSTVDGRELLNIIHQEKEVNRIEKMGDTNAQK